MSPSLPTRLLPIRRCSLLIVVSLLTLLVPTIAHAQNLIVHQSVGSEDGNPEKDADGVKNGVTVWKGGVVHVVDGQMHMSKGEDLVIQSGAIVKFADDFVYNNGVVQSFKPPTDAGLVAQFFYPDIGGIIQIDGAILTDIRDDEVGGDSNQDGAATTPSILTTSMVIRFSGSEKDYLKNSTLKYFAKIGHLGSMKIIGNTFVQFGQISPTDGYPMGMGPIPENSNPEIIGNTFDFTSNGWINLRGSSPILEKNIFTGKGLGPALRIGLRQANVGGNPSEGAILPLSGTTYVADNRFESNGGVLADAEGDRDSLFTKASFRAVIRNNHFRAPAPTVEAGIAVLVDANVEVIGNIVENHIYPLIVTFEQASFSSSTSPLQINNNRFEFTPGGVTPLPDNTSLFDRKGVMINAENNYWGDPSGPLDPSNRDGLYNPRGKGFRIGDGIDYRPFTGGTTEVERDNISITATATPTPLVPNAAATINVVVDRYDLNTAPTGKIVVILRDANGFILNAPGTILDATAGNHTATVPPITITVPETATDITVEAYIGPDTDLDGASSNVVRFNVPQPKSAFRFIGAFVPGTGFPLIPVLTRGSTIGAQIEFEYTHTTSNVNFEIELTERDAVTGRVIEVLQQITFSVPPGTNRKEVKVFTLTIPMRDILLAPSSRLYGRFVARDDNGNIIGKVDGGLPILAAANFVNVKSAMPAGVIDGNLSTLGRQFLLEGDLAAFRVGFDHSVLTTGVSDWQIWLGPVEIMNASGAVIQTYPPAGPFVSNVATGKPPARDMMMRMPDGAPPIPSGARMARVHLRMVKPQGSLTVATSHIDIEVRPQPVETVQLNAVAGAQMLSFAPIPVSLAISANQGPGRITAMEFNGQFRGSVAKPAASIRTTRYWKMIPLNRYWAVFDTLKETSVTATLTITYNPATDFPSTSGFNEDSLVICGLNPYSNELEELPTVLDRSTRTLTTPWSKFFDTWVVASRSTVVIGDVDEREDILSRSIASFVCYPNPVDRQAMLRFELRERAEVELEILDALGERVMLQKSGWLEPGSHEVVWETQELPEGVYLARLRAGVGERQLKIVVVK